MNIENYRFSISWSRLIPTGCGPVNPLGVEYYNKVIDLCLELDITPWITLYHWDLPQTLEDQGGWTNRKVVQWFSDFTTTCMSLFGDRVKHWMVLNEPMAFTGAGYFLGLHAPGKKGLNNFLAAAHHAALCQAEGARIIRSLRPECKVGTTFSFSHVEPFSHAQEDQAAALKVDAILNRLFLEPLLGLGYPTDSLPALARIEKFMLPGDENLLSHNMDFIGVQCYTREIVKHNAFIPFVQAKIVKAEHRQVHKTAMNWEVYPESMYGTLKKVGSYTNIPEIIITENGAAFPDVIEDDGMIKDGHRIAYLQEHIREVLRAKSSGIRIGGYFIWTFMDNFEWAEGYTPRFGLVHVDFKTQKRIIKHSGKWYRAFLKGTAGC